ncbi:hypothetical protein A2316_00210 [Candidatus Falkowbacteria bacterium RIFOXYB2_FULL_38_15]|uniref:Uncharacterized protein n=1 Tax=Candidatus Falkowbacteria bacterium RIFOXYA2_FULL_38_12 TaxID=1797993 RepID=A0A1F5S2V9_9BACT|nr:MAG: hypothetical protein A2257_02020 [Candidatus Falkowbacteria bacterium RIFOXYA2_FULL_38_12]OGF33616.1 MAG: hypothetical protein A2316_00210 [Candidatus Falkowbacteria bacterium RIFOXYB2_FULL_38_15]OGF43846.1 MAG: hypothetical protein A2555_03610 [Candidatus Falkowbacteria bacterium RIFOXYD2_FULL_39_16]
MNYEGDRTIGEQENLRSEISQRIQEMIALRMPLREIVAMFKGAEKFFSETKKGKNKVLQFSVEGFTDSLVAQNPRLKFPQHFFQSLHILIPPDEGEIITGSGEGMEEKGTIPRSQYLMEVLHELDKNYILINGKNDPGMMRSVSYQVFVIPELERIVLVSNETENATFVYFHDSDGARSEKDYKVFVEMNREELIKFGQEFAQKYSKEDLKKMGDRIRYRRYLRDLKGEGEKIAERWKRKIKELIANPIPKQESREEDGEEQKLEKVAGEERKRANVEEAPDGWITVGELADKLGVSNGRIEGMVRANKGKDDFLIYKARTGHNRPHISPKLQIMIESEIIEQNKLEEEAKELIKKGWLTKKGLREKIKTNHEEFNELLESKRSVHLECFKKAYFRGRPREFISPWLVDVAMKESGDSLVEDTFRKLVTIPTLVSRLGVDRETIIRLATLLSAEHSDWIKYKGRNRVIYLSQELADLVEKEINKQEEAPEGWLTVSALADMIGVEWETVGKRVGKFRETYPVKKYRTKRGVFDHLSPELVKIIKADLEK